jgi:hypothetical protein
MASVFGGSDAAFVFCNGETSTARFQVMPRELSAAALLELDPAEPLQRWPDLLWLGAGCRPRSSSHPRAGSWVGLISRLWAPPGDGCTLAVTAVRR